MALTLQRFRFYTSPDPADPAAEATELDLVILPADRMRSERLSTTELPPSQRGPQAHKSNAETYMLLWAWCAATRMGHTTDRFLPWTETVLDYDRLDASGELVANDTPATDVEDEPVDPTQTGASTS